MRSLLAAVALACLISAAVAAPGVETGIASIYGNGDGYAWRTDGALLSQRRAQTECERMDPGALTAAHRTLPIGSIVEVTNRRNGRVGSRSDQRPRAVRRRPDYRLDAGGRARRSA
jgi:rare lipoprotein A (peptidoglycan hydrolase)